MSEKLAVLLILYAIGWGVFGLLLPLVAWLDDGVDWWGTFAFFNLVYWVPAPISFALCWFLV